MLSSSIYRKYSTALNSAIGPAQSSKTKYALIRARRHKQAEELARASMSEHLYSPLRFQNARRNRNLPGLEKYATTHNAAYLADAMRGFFLYFQSQQEHTVLFHSVLSTYFVQAWGAWVVVLEHGALGNCKSSVYTEAHGYLCPLHSHFVLLILCSYVSCERAIRRPRSEAPCENITGSSNTFLHFGSLPPVPSS